MPITDSTFPATQAMRAHRGIRCPSCRKSTCELLFRKYPKAGGRRRYYKCACGRRFKTDEQVVVTPRVLSPHDGGPKR